MKKTTLLLIPMLVILFGVFACSDDDDVPVLKVEAASKIDLSKYGDLTCIVNDEVYDYGIEDNKAFIFPKKGGKIANVRPFDESISTGFWSSGILMYFRKGEIDWEKPVDQSTYDKLMYYDVLSGRKGGYLSSVISDVEIIHANSLFSFTLSGFPENTIIYTESTFNQTGKITPYITEQKIYQCIVPHAHSTKLSAVIGDKYYEVDFEKQTRCVANYSNYYFSFELVYNDKAEGDTPIVTVQNYKVEEWINQHLAE